MIVIVAVIAPTGGGLWPPYAGGGGLGKGRRLIEAPSVEAPGFHRCHLRDPSCPTGGSIAAARVSHFFQLRFHPVEAAATMLRRPRLLDVGEGRQGEICQVGQSWRQQSGVPGDGGAATAPVAPVWHRLLRRTVWLSRGCLRRTRGATGERQQPSPRRFGASRGASPLPRRRVPAWLELARRGPVQFGSLRPGSARFPPGGAGPAPRCAAHPLAWPELSLVCPALRLLPVFPKRCPW